MRVLSFLLAVMVLGLTTAPVQACGEGVKKEDTEASHACCSKDVGSSNHHKKEDKPCHGKDCNPFINCCGAMGFIPLGNKYFQLEENEFHSRNSYGYSTVATEVFNEEILDPPRT